MRTLGTFPGLSKKKKKGYIITSYVLLSDEENDLFVTNHSRLGCEDDNFIKRCELLEKVIDARTLLKPPTCRQLMRKNKQTKNKGTHYVKRNKCYFAQSVSIKRTVGAGVVLRPHTC